MPRTARPSRPEPRRAERSSDDAGPLISLDALQRLHIPTVGLRLDPFDPTRVKWPYGPQTAARIRRWDDAYSDESNDDVWGSRPRAAELALSLLDPDDLAYVQTVLDGHHLPAGQSVTILLTFSDHCGAGNLTSAVTKQWLRLTIRPDAPIPDIEQAAEAAVGFSPYGDLGVMAWQVGMTPQETGDVLAAEGGAQRVRVLHALVTTPPQT